MINTLLNSPLFKGISDENINKLFENEVYKINSYKKNEVIANQGDDCSTLSIILSGSVSIQNLYENGKILTLANFAHGDIFGEALIFSINHEYPATVMCTSNSKVLFIPKETILSLMHKSPKFAENTLRIFSNKILLLNKKIHLIELDSIRKKICKILIDNYKTTNSLIYNITSKKSLSEEIGVPRPSLSRELISMRDLGLLEFDLKEIRVLNLKALEDEFFD